jgi:PAS domain S-box-containing protein
MAPFEALVALVGIVVVALVLFSARLDFETFERARPLESLIEDMRVEVLLAQLWLEESISGDRSVAVRRRIVANVDDPLEECEAMLAGGSTEKGRLEPVAPGPARRNLVVLCRRLRALGRLTRARLGVAGQHRSAASDSGYDAAVADVLSLAARQDRFAAEAVSRELHTAQGVHLLIVFALALLLLAASVGVVRSRRSMQRASADSSQLAAIVASSQDAIIGLTEDGAVTTWNHGAEQLYGYTAEEMVGWSIMRIIPEREQDTARARLAAVVAGDEVVPFEARRITKRGDLVDVALRLSPVASGTEVQTRVASIARDISDRKNAERDLAERSAELERANADLSVALDRRAELEANLRALNTHLEDTVATRTAELSATVERLDRARDEAERAARSKSEFLSRMSHELRTPLNAILGFAQVLELENLTTDQRESVSEITASGRHLLGLVDDVLTVTRIDTGGMSLTIEPLSVREAIESAVGKARTLAAGASVALASDLSATEIEEGVLADRHMLGEVLSHLLSNAVKFNRRGGSVSVSAHLAGPADVRLEVTDTGAGIDPARVDALFVAFDRLGAERGDVGGTGLGLPVAKRLVELMGGRMGADSVPGEGSTFWIELPAAEPTHAAAATSAPIVLYIEDDAADLKLIESVFTQRPQLKLVVALNAALGLELVRKRSPNLVLLDLRLPDLDGEELLRRLRALPEGRDIPIATLSPHATTEEADRLLAAGADAYLTKPIDVLSLLQAVDRLLRVPRAHITA